MHLPLCIVQYLFWIAIFQVSTKFEDVFALKTMVFVTLYTVVTCGVEAYAANEAYTKLKHIEEFAFPSIHAVLSTATIWIFYMGMKLRLGAFSEFQHDFINFGELSQEEQMDQKLGLELSDDELEDFQKDDGSAQPGLSRALTVTNDDDMDRILEDKEDQNFSIQQE